MVRLRRCAFIALILSATLTGAVATAQYGSAIRVSGAEISAPHEPAPYEAWMTLRNRGDEDDHLIRVHSPDFRLVELHQTIMDGEVMGMRPLPGGVTVPARSEVQLQRGGLHLMLSDPTRPLHSGARVLLILRFQKSGEVEVSTRVD